MPRASSWIAEQEDDIPRRPCMSWHNDEVRGESLRIANLRAPIKASAVWDLLEQSRAGAA